MKTTLDIPDSVYREFKVKTAQNGEKMRNVVLAFIVAYNADEWRVPVSAPRSRKTTTFKMPEWAGIAKPFITRFPDDPLDAEKMRDDIVAFRRGAGE